MQPGPDWFLLLSFPESTVTEVFFFCSPCQFRFVVPTVNVWRLLRGYDRDLTM